MYVSHLNLQSPSPVCMFYFAHPFGGIATPPVSTAQQNPIFANDNRRYGLESSASDNSFGYKMTNDWWWWNEMRDQHLRYGMQHAQNYVPWPKETWEMQQYMLPPMIQMLHQKIGNFNENCEFFIRKKKFV